MFGYAGRILIVDLDTGRTRTEQVNMDVARKYIGGIGLGMRLWLDHTKPGVDPIGPENTLVVALGPVSGTMFPTAGNGHAFIAKSPATSLLGDAVSHGTLGAELKRAGYDAIILKGKEKWLTYYSGFFSLASWKRFFTADILDFCASS